MTQQIVALRDVAKVPKNIEASAYSVLYGNKITFSHPSQTNMAVNMDFVRSIRGFISPQTT
jgi:hypothetical protein